MGHHLGPSGLLILLPVLSSCDALGSPSVCTLEARPGIVVEVRDSLTGAPAASGALAIARDGLFADTLRGLDLRVAGAHERPGTYGVSVTKSGYRDWSGAGVRVTSGECHVHTVTLEARLIPT